MNNHKEPPYTLFTLFGAGGDLSQRLILPALFNLYLDGLYPKRFRLLAVDRKDYDDEELTGRYRDAVSKHSRRGAPPDKEWNEFASLIHHVRMDISDADGYTRLCAVLNETERAWDGQAHRVFYLALPPSLFSTVARSGLRLDSNSSFI